MWEIIYYELHSGRSPSRDFISSLHPKLEQLDVMNRIDQLSEHGYQLKFPDIEFIGDDLYALRIKVNRKQIRLFYFFFDKTKIVITNGIKKDYRRLKNHEIEIAKKYRSDYFKEMKK